MNLRSTYAPTKSAELHASMNAENQLEGGPPWSFSGIAIGNDDVLPMADGTRVLFRPNELKRAAASQAGSPLTVDHPEHEIGSSPPVESTIGTVTDAEYVLGKGVTYEAETHDPEIARGIKAGTFDVSVHPSFVLGDQDPDTGAYVAEDVTFHDLSLVTSGASAANTANWGAGQQLAAARGPRTDAGDRESLYGTGMEGHEGHVASKPPQSMVDQYLEARQHDVSSASTPSELAADESDSDTRSHPSLRDIVGGSTEDSLYGTGEEEYR